MVGEIWYYHEKVQPRWRPVENLPLYGLRPPVTVRMRKVGLLQNQALLPLLAYPHFDPHVNMSIISINSLSEFKEIVREVIYLQLE